MHNASFARPDGLENIHHPADHFDPPNIFCMEEERVVRRDVTVLYKSEMLQIPAENALRPVPKQYMTVRRWLDGSLHLFWREHELTWTQGPGQQTEADGRAGLLVECSIPWV